MIYNDENKKTIAEAFDYDKVSYEDSNKTVFEKDDSVLSLHGFANLAYGKLLHSVSESYKTEDGIKFGHFVSFNDRDNMVRELKSKGVWDKGPYCVSDGIISVTTLVPEIIITNTYRSSKVSRKEAEDDLDFLTFSHRIIEKFDARPYSVGIQAVDIESSSCYSVNDITNSESYSARNIENCGLLIMLNTLRDELYDVFDVNADYKLNLKERLEATKRALFLQDKILTLLYSKTDTVESIMQSSNVLKLL